MVAEYAHLVGPSDGTLKLRGLRGGTIAEITNFLSDMERAYNALYWFAEDAAMWRVTDRLWRRYVPFPPAVYSISTFRGENRSGVRASSDEVPPNYRIEVNRVSIQSPGFWEFLGGMNPLQQLREYLKDRHERRKDREYRECAEKERMKLDNMLLQRAILDKETSALREQIAIMRDVGYDDDLIRQIVWERLGPPLSQLGRHQDTRLIEGPVDDE